MRYITMRRRDTEQIVRTASITYMDPFKGHLDCRGVTLDPFKGHLDCIAHQ